MPASGALYEPKCICTLAIVFTTLPKHRFSAFFFFSLLSLSSPSSVLFGTSLERTAVDRCRQAGWQAGTLHTALSKTCCTNKNVFRITTTDFDSIKFISNEKCSRWAEQLSRIRLRTKERTRLRHTEKRHYVHRKWKARDEVRNKIVFFLSPLIR